MKRFVALIPLLFLSVNAEAYIYKQNPFTGKFDIADTTTSVSISSLTVTQQQLWFTGAAITTFTSTAFTVDDGVTFTNQGTSALNGNVTVGASAILQVTSATITNQQLWGTGANISTFTPTALSFPSGVTVTNAGVTTSNGNVTLGDAAADIIDVNGAANFDASVTHTASTTVTGGNILAMQNTTNNAVKIWCDQSDGSGGGITVQPAAGGVFLRVRYAPAGASRVSVFEFYDDSGLSSANRSIFKKTAGLLEIGGDGGSQALSLISSNVEYIGMASGGAVTVNETGAAAGSFRVESDNVTDMFMIGGAANVNQVAVNATPALSVDATLVVESTSSQAAHRVIRVNNNAGTEIVGITQDGGAWWAQTATTPTAPTNFAGIAAITMATAELKAIDGAQNITLLSPHNANGDWIFYSENMRTGKKVLINMEKFIHRMEEITGEKFFEIYESGNK